MNISKKTKEVNVFSCALDISNVINLVFADGAVGGQEHRLTASDTSNNMPCVSKSARAFHSLKRAKRDAE